MPAPRRFPPAPEPEGTVSHWWFGAYVAVLVLFVLLVFLGAIGALA